MSFLIAYNAGINVTNLFRKQKQMEEHNEWMRNNAPHMDLKTLRSYLKQYQYLNSNGIYNDMIGFVQGVILSKENQTHEKI